MHKVIEEGRIFIKRQTSQSRSVEDRSWLS
jgi:hypothetical protein